MKDTTDDSSVLNMPSPELTAAGASVPSFHEKLLESMYDGVYFVDKERQIQYWNKAAELLTGYAAEEVVGRHCFDNLLMHVNDEGCALCTHECPLSLTIADGERREVEVYLRHRLGHRIPVSVRVAPIVDAAGRVVGAVEVFTDVTAKKNMQRRVGELETIAFLDPLTGVSNRRYVEMKVKQAIQEVEQFGRAAGLLIMDVDRFKSINDTHGHEIGDAALKVVSQTLTSCLRSGDTVGRWGGDEFIVVVTDLNSAALDAFAERCRMLIAESKIPVGHERLGLTVSLGATSIQCGDSSESAIKRADDLLYRSKLSGRNRVTPG